MADYDYDEYPGEPIQKGFFQSNLKAIVGIGICLVVLVVIIVAIVLGIELTQDSTETDGETPANPEFWQRISLEGLQNTLHALQDIADANGGTRTIESSGYNASVAYIQEQLAANPELVVTTQPFLMTVSQLNPGETPSLSTTNPDETFDYGVQFVEMSNSGVGIGEGPIFAVPDVGCNDEDWKDFPIDSIALILRGNCTFEEKCNAAVRYGAAGVLIYNNATELLVAGAGPSPPSIPVFGLTNALGLQLKSEPEAIVTMNFPGVIVNTWVENVIAETKSGNPDTVVVVGSHLDSVPAGPGINDNGSGSAANLQMALSFTPDNLDFVNRVRFIWYGAEEKGLVGSEAYVGLLNDTERAKVALNLNFDMLGSPNFQRGILNGSAADPEIRQGCELIMNSFINFFEDQKLTWELIPFTGRSDYGPYLEAMIPAGGIETGAEKIKTMEGRTKFGGLAETPYDPCYHLKCDTYDNINFDVLLEMSQAAAYALQTFAVDSDLRTKLGTSPAPAA